MFGVANRDGSLLVVEEAWCGGLYGLLGGKVEEGESLTEALRREFLEETGLTLRQVGDAIHDLDWNYYSLNKDKYFRCSYTFYHVSCSDRPREEVDADDISGMRWINLREIDEDRVRHSHKRFLQAT